MSGLPVEHPDSQYSAVLAEGQSIKRFMYPNVVWNMERALGQQRLLTRELNLFQRVWNRLMPLVRFSEWVKNPKHDPAVLWLPNWTTDDILTLNLKLATKEPDNDYLRKHGCDSCCPQCLKWESDGNYIETTPLVDGSERRTCMYCDYTWKAIFTPAGFIPIGEVGR
jgi:hypothetical protein